MQPLVSVIIPTYNGQRWLPESAQSVLSQTYANLELIIIDDGSQDGTRDIVESLCRKDSRVRAIYKANGGVATARNTGIAATQGKYVSLLDQDDLFEPSKIEHQTAYLERHPETDLVYGQYLVTDDVGRILKRQPAIPHITFRELWESCSIHLGASLICKSTLEAVGRLNEKVGWADDIDLVLRIAKRGKIAFQEGVVFRHRRHGKNTSAADERDFYRMTLRALSVIGPFPEEGVTVRKLHQKSGELIKGHTGNVSERSRFLHSCSNFFHRA